MANQIGNFEQLGRSYDEVGAFSRSTGRAVIEGGEVKAAGRKWYSRLVDWIRGPSQQQVADNKAVATTFRRALESKYGESIAGDLTRFYLRDQIRDGTPLSARRINLAFKAGDIKLQKLQERNKSDIIKLYTLNSIFDSKVKDLAQKHPAIAGNLKLSYEQMQESTQKLSGILNDELDANTPRHEMATHAQRLVDKEVSVATDIVRHLNDYYSKGERFEEALNWGDAGYSEAFELPPLSNEEKEKVGSKFANWLGRQRTLPTQEECGRQLNRMCREYFIEKAFTKHIDEHFDEVASQMFEQNDIEDSEKNRQALKDNILLLIYAKDFNHDTLKSFNAVSIVRNAFFNVFGCPKELNLPFDQGMLTFVTQKLTENYGKALDQKQGGPWEDGLRDLNRQDQMVFGQLYDHTKAQGLSGVEIAQSIQNKFTENGFKDFWIPASAILCQSTVATLTSDRTDMMLPSCDTNMKFTVTAKNNTTVHVHLVSERTDGSFPLICGGGGWMIEAPEGENEQPHYKIEANIEISKKENGTFEIKPINALLDYSVVGSEMTKMG